MLRDHRKVGLIVVALLLAGFFVEHDGVAVALSIVALAVALAAIVMILLARRAEREDSTDP
jgi:Na+/H+ antiporter NhaD/arsenite permease-like protein